MSGLIDIRFSISGGNTTIACDMHCHEWTLRYSHSPMSGGTPQLLVMFVVMSGLLYIRFSMYRRNVVLSGLSWLGGLWRTLCLD